MMRPVQPNDKRPDFASESTKSPGKRRRVASACIPCRERKTKCDGVQPNCSTCKALYNTRCSYDSDSGQSRKSTTRRRTTAVTREKDSAITIIRAIKSYPMAEVTNIIEAIRNNDNLDTIAEKLRKTANVPDVSDFSMTGGQPDQLIGSIASLHHRLPPPHPYQNNIYHESVVPGGPSIPPLASPLSYDPTQNFSWSPSIDGSIPLANYTGTDQMDNFAGLSQLGDRGELYQYGSSNNNSVNGLYYEFSQDFSGSAVIDGSILLASDTEVGHMYYSAGLPQPGDQWHLYQDGSIASELATMEDENYSGGLRGGLVITGLRRRR